MNAFCPDHHRFPIRTHGVPGSSLVPGRAPTSGAGETRRSILSCVLFARCSETLQPGCGSPAFVCLLCGGKKISRYRSGRSEVRHGPLGRGHLLLPPVVGTSDCTGRLATRTIGNHKSGGPRRRFPARTRLYRRTGPIFQGCASCPPFDTSARLSKSHGRRRGSQPE